MRLKNVALATLGLAALPAPKAISSSNASPERPNILLILVDDLGLGDLSCQYANDLHTPNIDRIFSTGVRFDNFYANSNVSSPSRASLMTGCFPDMVGVPGVIRTKPEQNWGYFLPDAVTMPQLLGENGYETALVGKWHLGLTSPNLPNERGFDYFHGFLGDMMDDYYTHRREGFNYMYENSRQIDPEGHATELFTQWGIDYIREQASHDSPFFLYLAYNAPHQPLQPPQEWLDRVVERYPSMPNKRQRLIALIEHLDYNVGLVVKGLEESGQLENTLVIFASDNGGDRGSMANNGPTRGAKGEMYEGGLRVVCAFNQPGRFSGGRSVQEFAMLMDIFPTICDMLGIEPPEGIDGISVLDAANGVRQETEDRYIYWLRYEGGEKFARGAKPQTAVRYDGYKLLRNVPTGDQELFRISADSLENVPLPTKGKVFRKLDKAMQEHFQASQKIPHQPSYANPDIAKGIFNMKTPFTDDVSRELPLPEYPRPQFEREDWINLNGEWNYKIESCSFGGIQGLTSADSWTNRKIPTQWQGKMLVPFSIDAPLSGVGHVLRPNEVLWYERKFDVPKKWKGKRIILHFQACDWETSVYVNGKRIGQHRGGYSPFSFDVTEYVQTSGNVLNVCVWDATEQQAQAIGKQIMPEHRQGFRYQPTGGIWQTVWLEAVPESAIEGIRIIPDYDAANVRIEMTKPSGQTVLIKIKDGGNVVASEKTIQESAVIHIPDFKPWSPDYPHLYDLELSLQQGSKTLDKVKSYFGMRKMEVKRDSLGNARIFLNNEPIFQYGPLDQGYWPDGILTPPSEDAMLFDLKYLKNVGANMVRVHIKTHPERWYYHADRLGLLVWQDMICMPKFDQTVTLEASRQWGEEFKEMIVNLFNHPSIVLWVAFNEGWGQHETEKVTAMVKELDPTRLVTCASGWNDAPVGDIMDIHDYTFYPRSVPDWKVTPSRASVVGEAGGVNLAIPGHTWYSSTNLPKQKGHYTFEPKSEFDFIRESGRHTYSTTAEFENAYRKFIKTICWLKEIGGCNGVVYTQISDVEHELNGWLTYDRVVSKIPVETMREFHSLLFEKLHYKTLLDWEDSWKDADGGDVKLPAGDDNPFIDVATATSRQMTLTNSFDADNLEKEYCVAVYGMSDYEIFINGTLFRRTKIGNHNYEPSYGVFPISSEDNVLKKGRNEISIKVLPSENILFDFAVFQKE